MTYAQCTYVLSSFILQLFAVCQSIHCEKASYLPFFACANELATEIRETNRCDNYP